MKFQINWASGKTENFETFNAAVEAVRGAYPNAVVGHDGDLDGGGDRTLCWACEGDATDDDGANAVAEIVVG